MKYYTEVFGLTMIALGLYGQQAHAVPQTCMDKHGSTFSAESCYDDKGGLRDVTPEYMYTDRETQRLQMQLNALSAQALANIARAGAGMPDISTTNLSNDQSQQQSSSNSSRSNSNATSRSNSNSNSNASNSNSNANTNVNSNSTFTGVFN